MDRDERKTFFDVKGFIEGKITELDSEKPLVSKNMVIGEEHSQLSSKDIDWKKELELFVQADINKPAYRQSYEVSRPDSMTYQYTVKPGTYLPVHYLKIILNQPSGIPVRIEALLKAENKLYKSEKKIALSCAVQNGTSRIVSYEVSGFQKLIAMKAKPFKVTGEVHF